MGTAAAAAISSRSFWLQSTSKCSTFSVKPKICFLVKTTNNPQTVAFPKDSSFSSFFNHLPAQKDNGDRCRFSLNLKANSSPSVGSTATEEPATKVKFQSSVNIPGCSTSLSLLGTGYREKVFTIIGVKVYAAGFYVNQSVFPKLDAWKGSSADDLKQDSVLFDTILKAPLEKSLQIVLVRDVDGKTFWDALDEAISPRIKQPTAASESALSSFRRIFQGRSLNKGTFIFLTWVDSIKMLVSSSSEGMPSVVDATIESTDVTSALFDVFLGGDPVSPSLKNSVANGLAANLK